MAASRNFESDCRHFDPRLSAAIQGLLELSSVQLELSQPKYIALYQALTSALGGLSAFVSKRTGSGRGVLEVWPIGDALVPDISPHPDDHSNLNVTGVPCPWKRAKIRRSRPLYGRED